MTKITWQAVALLATVGAIVVALANTTSWSSSEILAVAAVLAGLATGVSVGTAMTGGVQSRVEQLQAETTAQTQTLNTIDRRTNGELDQRIEAGSRAAADQVLAELREQGVIR